MHLIPSKNHNFSAFMLNGLNYNFKVFRRVFCSVWVFPDTGAYSLMSSTFEHVGFGCYLAEISVAMSQTLLLLLFCKMSYLKRKLKLYF